MGLLSQRVRKYTSWPSRLRRPVLAALLCAGCSVPTTLPDLNRPPDSLNPPQNEEQVIEPAGIINEWPVELTFQASRAFCCDRLAIEFAPIPEPTTLPIGLECRWDFGDGRSAEGCSAAHAYSWPGNYSVALTLRAPDYDTVEIRQRLELSGDSEPITTPEAEAPSTIAVSAGPDQFVTAGDTVRLSATVTTEDTAPIRYRWQQTYGPEVTLSSPTTSSLSFAAPFADVQHAYGFRITAVQNNEVADDVVSITVFPKSDNPADPADPVDPAEVVRPIIVDAGPDRTVTPGTTVRITAQVATESSAPIHYAWRQTSGPSILLDGADRNSISFVPPPAGSRLVYVFRVTATQGEQFDDDTVSVAVSPAESGRGVMFVEQPRGAQPAGEAEVTWMFWQGVQPSEVTLLLDCCECRDTEIPADGPNNQGLYSATIEIPAGRTVWYSVFYSVNGVRYRSQSNYINPPSGNPPGPPAPVIWSFDRQYDPNILEDALSSGQITHVFLFGGDFVEQAFDDPEVLNAIRICREYGAQVIWSRQLWHNFHEFQGMDEVFDPEFYIAAIEQVQGEATALGADYTALDCEAYSNVPLDDYLSNPIPPADYERMSQAITLAAAGAHVDFVIPSGSHGAAYHPNNLYGLLGRTRIASSTYYDAPHKNCRITYEYEIFAAFVHLSTERPDNGLYPYFLIRNVLDRRYLWSASDGAPTNVNGLFLYTGYESDARQVAHTLSTLTPATP